MLGAKTVMAAEESIHHLAVMINISASDDSHIVEINTSAFSPETPLRDVFNGWGRPQQLRVVAGTEISLLQVQRADGTFTDATAEENEAIWSTVREMDPTYEGGEDLSALPLRLALFLGGESARASSTEARPRYILGASFIQLSLEQILLADVLHQLLYIYDHGELPTVNDQGSPDFLSLNSRINESIVCRAARTAPRR